MNVKESLELLEVVKVLAQCYRQARADGSVNWFDLPKFFPVFQALGTAFDGLEKVEAEIKDLDAGEILLLKSKLDEIAASLRRTAP